MRYRAIRSGYPFRLRAPSLPSADDYRGELTARFGVGRGRRVLRRELHSNKLSDTSTPPPFPECSTLWLAVHQAPVSSFGNAATSLTLGMSGSTWTLLRRSTLGRPSTSIILQMPTTDPAARCPVQSARLARCNAATFSTPSSVIYYEQFPMWDGIGHNADDYVLATVEVLWQESPERGPVNLYGKPRPPRNPRAYRSH